MFENLTRSEYLFDAKKNFFDLSIVKFFFYTITITSIICCVVISLNSDLHVDLSYYGFNKFVEIFKVPLAILALNIPVIAILGAFHKSEQTRLQIVLSNGQNNFSNYYKHLEEFKKLISGIYVEGERCEVELLHKKLFSNAVNGDYSLSPHAKEQLRLLTLDLFYTLKNLILDTIWGVESSKNYIFPPEGLDEYKIYNYLYFKNVTFSSSYRGNMPDIILCEKVSEFVKSTVKALTVVELIVYFDHTSDGKSSLDRFLLKFDYNGLCSDMDELLRDICNFDGIEIPNMINTDIYTNEKIAKEFVVILEKHMDISVLDNIVTSI